MKVITYLMMLTVMMGMAGCKKKLTQFYMSYNSQIVVSSSLGQLIPIAANTPEITSNSEATFESNDTKKKHIKSIYLKEAVLTITSPSNETFSFLNSVTVKLYHETHGETVIAELTEIPSSVGNSISLNLKNVDLQRYIKEDSFSLRVEYKTDETIPEDVYIDIYTNYLVEAQLKKL